MFISVTSITPGDGKVYPKTGQKVCIHYEGKYDDSRPFHSTRAKGKPVTFTVGEGIIIKGLEEGIKKVSVGERARIFFTGPFMQGNKTGKKGKGFFWWNTENKDVSFRPCRSITLDVLLLSVS